MSEPKGNKLYVNLGASQTRRRLKGFGHGVRKVQSAGRNQALIIHTATGQHLRELQARFSDVGFSDTDVDLGDPISNLMNLGPTSSQWLRDAGIVTVEQLRRIGAASAFLMVRRRQPAANRNLLWALAAGLQSKDWRSLSDAEKQLLLQEVDSRQVKCDLGRGDLT
jgi:hypothetical protein